MLPTLFERVLCTKAHAHSRYTRIDAERDFPPFLVGDGKPPDSGFRTLGQSDRVCRMCHA
jgi:hypothetical protein